MEATADRDGTGSGLVDHWSWSAKRGLMNPNTAGALRAACTQVMGVLEGWQDVDVRSLDVEGTLDRFVNLRKKDFKPESLETYKKRFRQAVSLYIGYLDDPAGWKPRQRSQSPARRTVTTAPAGSVPAFGPSEGGSAPATGDLVTYPFPLRTGVMARLTLPVQLTTADIRRLTRYMESLVADDEGSQD